MTTVEASSVLHLTQCRQWKQSLFGEDGREKHSEMQQLIRSRQWIQNLKTAKTLSALALHVSSGPVCII